VTRASPADLQAALQRAGTSIPFPFYAGTADHEADFCIDCPCSDGGISCGIFQVNQSEQAESGCAGSLFDLDTNTCVYVYLAERNRTAIRAAAGIPDGAPDPWDMGAYLAIAHNCGLQTALTSLANFPTGDPTYLGWREYQGRNYSNPSLRCGCNGDGTGICAYGDDVLYDPVTGVALMTRTPALQFGLSAVLVTFAFLGARHLVGARA
jgi:hypothetical protein